MGWFNQYPYEDNEELNLDYLLAKVAALKDMIDETNAQIDAFNSLLVNKADKATTLYGYGITDAYTKTQVDNLLVLKADKANVYNKTEVDNLLLPKVNASDLATVATSGSYTDLINKPTIPAPQVNSDWNANSGVAKILNKPTTLSGYGITDAYTKTETDNAISDSEVFTITRDITILSTATGHTITSSAVFSSAYELISLTPKYTTDFYYYSDNKVFQYSFLTNSRQIVIFAQGGVADSADRTLTFIVAYKKI